MKKLIFLGLLVTNITLALEFKGDSAGDIYNSLKMSGARRSGGLSVVDLECIAAMTVANQKLEPYCTFQDSEGKTANPIKVTGNNYLALITSLENAKLIPKTKDDDFEISSLTCWFQHKEYGCRAQD